MVGYIELSPEQVSKGEWQELLFNQWTNGNFPLPRVMPQATGNPELRKAVETMIDNNGSYHSGDNAVISSYATAVPMACETALALREGFGIESVILLKAASDSRMLDGILKECLGADASKWSHTGLKEICDNVYSVYDAMRTSGKGHLIIPFPTEEDVDKKYRSAVSVFSTAMGYATRDLNEMLKDGRLFSWDIWLYPSASDFIDMNKHLPKDKHWTREEYDRFIFEAEAAAEEAIKKFAFATRGDEIEILARASNRGGVVTYTDEMVSDLSFRVYRRPLLLDSGKLGMNSICGTRQLTEKITNYPAGEIFIAPIESSANGVIVFDAPLWTENGTIQAPYRIHFENGMVVSAKGPDKDSTAVLRHATGIKHINKKPDSMTVSERAAFQKSRIIAEFALAAINPVIYEKLKLGKLVPSSKNPLGNEKFGMNHLATGENDIFGGKTGDNVRGMPVEHIDFISARGGKLAYSKN